MQGHFFVGSMCWSRSPGEVGINQAKGDTYTVLLLHLEDLNLSPGVCPVPVFLFTRQTLAECFQEVNEPRSWGC